METKKLTDEEIEEELLKYVRREYKHTREYLIEQLKKNSDFKAPKGIFSTLDIKEAYENKFGDKILGYDWSKVPEFVYSQNDKFTLICNELDRCGEKIGDYITSYKNLVTKGRKPVKYSFDKLAKQKVSNEFQNNFNDWIKENRPEIKIVSDYNGSNNKILVECPIHGIYETTPSILKRISRWTGEYTGNCPICNRIKFNERYKLSNEDFLKKAKEVHGNRYIYPNLNFKNTRDKIEIYDTLREETFYQDIHSHLLGRGNNKNKSKGEEYIAQWLEENDICYLRDEPIEPLWENGLFGKKSGVVKLDFIFNDGGLLYWIEYNGIQHYQYSPRFQKTEADFINQIRRDQNIRDYVNFRNRKRRQIVYIEIPYTYHSYNDIKFLLDEIVLKLKPVSIINQVDVVIPEGYNEKGEKL